MASFKNNPAFFTTLLFIGAVTAGEAWLIYSQSAESNRLTGEVEQKRDVLQRFSTSNPFPSRDNSAAIEADRVHAQETLAGIRKALQASSELVERYAAAKVPATPTDAFFDLASFVERIRENAVKADVVVPQGGWFGFSTYSSTGPVEELIEPVFRQRQYVEYLVGALLESKPREIRAVERSRPLTLAQKEAIKAAEAGGVPSLDNGTGTAGDAAADFFVIDSRSSAKNEGFVDTSPFRLTFTGTTEVLRTFLNELALFKLPVVVRSVEVSPLDKALTGPQAESAAPRPSALFGVFGQDAAAGAAPVSEVKPLVEQIDSVFVVTVEFIKLVDKTAPTVNTP
jgi:hypothetical protein